MCDEIGVFTDKEVQKLDPKGRKALRDEALKHLKSPAIKSLMARDPIAQVIHPNTKVRKAMRAKLRSKLSELKKASSK